MTLRIRHVVATVGVSARQDLQDIQDLTVDSIRRALRCTEGDIEVEVRSVHFSDETVDAPGFVDLPIITRSVLDVGEFEVPRRLPLLRDVLAGFGDPSEFDVAVLTNADICVQPLFYEVVADITAQGYDACSITRRTVQPRFAGSSLAQLSVTGGTVHPGHDCYVFASSLLDGLDVGNVSLGVRYVARALGWGLQLAATDYRVFADLHATFHVGDDRQWVDPRFRDYDRHGIREAQGVVSRLVDRFGRDRVERLQGVGTFLDALDAGVDATIGPPRRRTYRTIDPPEVYDSPRMVFCATSGRTGTEFLATLLGQDQRVNAGHERPPTMAGEWLRRIAYEAPTASYAERMHKVAAIRAELESLQPHDVYVDTSHMFVKTHADVVLDSFEHGLVSVIVLRRDPVDVARSIFELGYFSVAGRQWLDWMVSPTAPHAMFRITPEQVTGPLDLIFGYLVDTECRTQDLRERAPGVDWIDTRLEELVTVAGAVALHDRLGLRVPKRLDGLVGARVNARTRAKAAKGLSITRGEVESRLDAFLTTHRQRPQVALFAENHGLGLPSSP